MKRPRAEDCLSYIKSVQKTSKFNEFLQVMKEFKSLPTYEATNLVFAAARIKQVFHGHPNLILRFNMIFLPKRYAIEVDDYAEQNRVFKSTKRVQAEDSNKALLLHEADDYYHAIQVDDCAEQNRVFKSTKRVEANKALLLHEGDDYHEDYKFFENIIRKEKFRNPDEYKRYLKCLYLYSKKIISEGELIDMVGDLLQYDGTAFPSTANKDKVQSDPQKDERETDFEASTSKRRKLDEPMIGRLSNCEIVNPSYQLSTERILASGRTELGVAVLNDSWVSADSTPEGDSSDTCRFKKNVYEKNLFKFEDDRCERDRQFELVKGTIECVEELLREIVYNTIDAESICIKDHFKVLRLGCIKRLYGESWQGVEDALLKNAVPVLHDILTQLQKKMKEVTSRLSVTYRTKMKAVYLKNFRKSLDYGGNSSGEQQDTTSSSSKDDDAATSNRPNLLAEPTT
ncbi:hypothetical protein C5167_002428 [Papaver somniferum]|uniref:Histone deacetylase interacting domain-containing protein n=1 Tax=Papaver somniferum TaxID=3469 RepID=A0A4Y7L1R2_PAPSO|nr:paired amphipathic helix protein Sin3-like 3 [Papaver somniferum]RZC78169.1 hypothetical protein C5167_002428 [Papaver somniferum]